MAINAMGEADTVIPPEGVLEFRIKDYLAMPASSVDEETGEEKEFTRLVLFSPEGKTFVTTSIVAPHRLLAILSLYPPERVQKGIKVVICKRESRRTGRTYHDIKVVPECE